MSKDNQQNETSISLSKQRKLARKKEIQQMKRNAVVSKIVSICVVAALCIGLVSFIGYKIYRNQTKVVANKEFSKYLTDNGFIDGVNATSMLELCDYSNLTAPSADVVYADDKVEADIKSVLESHATLNKETQIAIADGTKVNIDYVGTIDGEEFSGGNTEGKGTDLTIGSGSYIGDFEQQLIGHKVGEEVTINATFPDPYTNNPDLAGKDAVFTVTVNGIYVNPEFNDEFVKANLSTYADTADGYREYVKTSNNDKLMTTWIETYLADNTTVTSYPQDYVKQLKCLQKYSDINMYNYMNQMSQSYSGTDYYKSFEAMVGMSEAKYDKSLKETAEKEAKNILIYQAILEKEGITLTVDDLKATYPADTAASTDSTTDTATASQYDTDVENYGLGYLMQNLVKDKAIEIVKGHVTVQ